MDTVAATPEDVARKIRVEQIRLLYRSINSVVASNLLVAVAIVIGLWNMLPHTLLVVWFALMLGMVAARYQLFRFYQQHFTEQNAEGYARRFTLLAGINGALWGVCGLMPFAPEDLEYQMLVVMALVGWGAGAVTTQHSNLPTFFFYFVLLLTPVVIRFMASGHLVQISIAIMIIAYMLALTYYVLNINRSLVETLKLRYENVELLARLREQKEEAERANLAKSRFLAAASHDLRQPLYALTLFTSSLDSLSDSPKTKSVVGQINTSVKALQKLFDALLDISRLDAGTTRINKIHFSIKPVLQRLANDYNPIATEKGLLMHWPDFDAPVFSDVNLFEQILRNILSNAIRYTASGQIDIQCDIRDDKVCIAVRDTGIGIPPDKQELIFEEYSQINNPERDRTKGLGLGLAIVRRAAALLGHGIDVQSRPGEGSTFTLKADLGDRSQYLSRPASEDDSITAPPPSFLVLVIDDEQDILNGIQGLLQIWGYSVLTATNQDDALNQLAQLGRAPDAIITDYRLRENRTGIDAIHAIYYQYHNRIPALIVTGDIEASRLREVSNSGFPVLHKPVAPTRLRQFLRNAHTGGQTGSD